MQKILFEKLKEAFASVLPITLIVLVVSHTPLVTFCLRFAHYAYCAGGVAYSACDFFAERANCFYG